MSSPASALKLENVLYEKKGPIAYVTINRPKVLNALNAKTISELRSVFEDARDDSRVVACRCYRVLRLSGVLGNL